MQGDVILKAGSTVWYGAVLRGDAGTLTIGENSNVQDNACLLYTSSSPAAVISMGGIRVLLKKNSSRESNMGQTIGSAGESLAAGAIFTMPALFLLSLIHI